MLIGCQKDRKTSLQTERQIKRQRLFSLVVKTKVVHNVNRMSERQADRQLADRQTKRKTVEDKTTFQPIDRQAERHRQTDR